jgi:hypothetical protein
MGTDLGAIFMPEVISDEILFRRIDKMRISSTSYRSRDQRAAATVPMNKLPDFFISALTS